MPHSPNLAFLTLILAGLSLLPPLHAAQLEVTYRASVSTGGVQADGDSTHVAVSADGNLVVFQSGATNLVPGDLLGCNDIFLRDLAAGTTTRISAGVGGAEADEFSGRPWITPDGRFVIFESWASNLVPGDGNLAEDVFLFDRQTGIMELVSVDSAGIQGNSRSYYGTSSADGRFVVFTSESSNLVPGDTNGVPDVFLRDRLLGVTERVSIDGVNVQANGASLSGFPVSLHTSGSRVSDDGNSVVFWSVADNLGIGGDWNGMPDVFLRERGTATTILVSRTTSGDGANGPSEDPAVSQDGQWVLFFSLATNLVPGFPLGSRQQIYRWNRQSMEYDLPAVDSNGNVPSSWGLTFTAALSADGQTVAFATNTPGGLVTTALPNLSYQVLTHNYRNGVTRLVSLNSLAQAQSAPLWFAELTTSISADGRFACFSSTGTNLVLGDSNGVSDTFVHDRQSDGPLLEITNLIAGGNATVRVTGGSPGGTVLLGLSLGDQGPVATPYGLIHLGPLFNTWTLALDPAGSVQRLVPVPVSARGASLWLQGLDLPRRYPTTIYHGIVQ